MHEIRKETIQIVDYDPRRMLQSGIPVILALMAFLVSAGYIAYRMLSSYNYNKRWQDYDECGI